MMSDFDKLVSDRNSLVYWWNMRNTIARYDNSRYVLRVDFMHPRLVTFCGQETCGGQNYHDAPKFFAEAIGREVSKRYVELTTAAYDAEMKRLNAAIDAKKEEVLRVLQSCEARP